MAQIAINEGLAWLKTLKKRHEELLALRNDNAHRERRFYGASADKEIVKEPVYDVKVLDRLVTRRARDSSARTGAQDDERKNDDRSLTCRRTPIPASREARELPSSPGHSPRGAAAGAHAGCPLLCARDPEDSLRILRFLADQLGTSDDGVLKRYDRKPKRLASRKLYMLQGLPGVGPALAHRLLLEFGYVERVVTADEEALMRVRGIGREESARIWHVMR